MECYGLQAGRYRIIFNLGNRKYFDAFHGVGGNKSGGSGAVFLEKALKCPLAHPVSVVMVVVETCCPFDDRNKDSPHQKRRAACCGSGVIGNDDMSVVSYEPAGFPEDGFMMKGVFFMKGKTYNDPVVRIFRQR